MYSQSKGRHFNVGQHEDLLVYLLSVCPLHPGEDWEEDKKLNLILSKVQEHQQSLREPGSSGGKTKPTIFHAFLWDKQYYPVKILSHHKTIQFLYRTQWNRPPFFVQKEADKK